MQKDKTRLVIKHFVESEKTIKLSLVKLRNSIIQTADLISNTFKNGGKLLICGNGGSAAEAQHFSAELVGRYIKDRKAFSAISLSTDTSALTAIGNDYGFSKIFSRQVEALAKTGDLLYCISTSGNSKNVIQAAITAKKMGLTVITMSGSAGGLLKQYGDISLIVPSKNTPFIQEVHLIIIHTICDLIDFS